MANYREQHLTPNGIQTSINKGWKPNMMLSNMAVAQFQEPSDYVAPDIFPILPVQFSTGNYYIFNKEELAKDQYSRKPAFGKASPAVFSHRIDTYTVDVDQIIIGIDQIQTQNYQRSGAPDFINSRRAKTRLATEQAKMHLDNIFARGFFRPDAWENVETGAANDSASKTFKFFDDANSDIIGFFGDKRKEMLLNGRRRPNRLTLGIDTYNALCKHPQILERILPGGTPAQPADVDESALAKLLKVGEVKVLYGVQNVANLGAKGDFQFTFNPKDAMLTYCPSSPSLEEPSAGYIITWDPLGNGSWLVTDAFEGEPGTHSEFVEQLMSVAVKKTCDDLCIYLSGCVQ